MDSPRCIRIDDYDYPLPEARIARHPLSQRDGCRLLVADGGTAALCIDDKVFTDLPGLLPEGAMVVCNDTRVVNARLRFHKPPTAEGLGARVEVFCLEPVKPVDYQQAFASTGPVTWRAFVGNSKKWGAGQVLTLECADGLVLEARRVSHDGASSLVEIGWNDPSLHWGRVLELAGELPIPPYLNRATEESDLDDYQTVYANEEGSVAAPTAGLHFTPELLQQLDQTGYQRRSVTLHVGAGTFQPVKSDTLEDHEMHSEFIQVNRSLIEELAEGKRPVVAVGTTSVRTLESLPHIGAMIAAGTWEGTLPQWTPYEETTLDTKSALHAILAWLDKTGQTTLTAATRLLIAPGYRYRLVDAMVTNFHQPRSTLLLLVSAFLGGDRWREIYDHALANPCYRFLSYGDACFFTHL